MSGLLLSALGLGLAGIDPAGLLIALAALAAGARERTVLAFAAIVIFGTALLGTLLSLTLGPRLAGLDWTALRPPPWVGASLELAVAVALLAWAAIRSQRPGARPPRPDNKRARTGTGLLLAGVFFAVTGPLDPTLLGLVVLAGRGEPVLAVASAHLLWILISQLPLTVLAGAVVAQRHHRVVDWLTDFMSRARPLTAVALTAGLTAAGAFMLLDAGSWFLSGRFLVFDY